MYCWDMRYKSLHVVALLCAVLLTGCSAHGGHNVGSHPADVLNRKARTWQYRDLDSAAHYAAKAYDEAEHYIHGRSVACNMLGFVAFMRMEYDEALRWYDEVKRQSGCELERLVADVGRMNVFQRMADNLSFYDCRVSATKRLAHINEESAGFSPAEQERLQSVVNDLHMVNALHHFMIGQRPEAYAEMREVANDEALRADTAQWLKYIYIKGIGLDVEGDTREQRRLRRYTYLNNCLRTSRTAGYRYFEGLALSGLSNLLADSLCMVDIARQRPNSFAQLEETADMSVGISMDFITEATASLEHYGDRYGVINAMIQMASLHSRRGDYPMALDILQQALDSIAWHYSVNNLPADSMASLSLFDVTGLPSMELSWMQNSEGRTIPDALCRLREEASLAFAGLGDKVASDYNRNMYLDLLELTRQDKEVESRFFSLKRQRRTMSALLGVTILGAALLTMLIILLTKRRKSRGGGYEQQLRNLVAEAEKRVYLHQRHIDKGKRDNIVRKASFSVVTGIMPYIDRIVHEVDRLQSAEVWDNIELRERKLEYIGELASEINGLNEILSQWITTTQGMVHLHIESFALSEVFVMIGRGVASFAMKGITLDVQPTDAVVKADKALTFFMLNTLADNARKFTSEGGRVSISAEVCAEYVELSVSDNGVGMSDEDVRRILNEKVYDSAAIGRDLPPEQHKNKGSGFGLLNCKGIIDKYRKTDVLFEVCRMGIDSRKGEGSRFWFRLPKGVRRMLMALCVMLSLPAVAMAEDREDSYSSLLERASAFADSVYFANVNGRYEEAIAFADSSLLNLNAHHRKYASEYIDTLTATRGNSDVEIRWWFSDYATDYHTLLDIRNELAVANLALHRWDDYRYNNSIYNELYKLISEDRTLIDYCNRMQRYNSNISVALLICILLVLGYLCVIIYTFISRLDSAYRNIESAEDEEHRAWHEENRLYVQNMVLDNCLSTIKHETVYYPNRIRQLVGSLGGHDERCQLKGLIAYYKVVFSTLAGCASRQLEEVTFRRSVIPVDELLQSAATYHAKLCCHCGEVPPLVTTACNEDVLCDVCLSHFLLEQLIDVSIAAAPTDHLSLTARADGEFVRFILSNTSRQIAPEVLQTFFYPISSSIESARDGRLLGAEYIICRQIIREHDSYFNHIGCRIKAESIPGGYAVWFTLPRSLH